MIKDFIQVPIICYTGEQGPNYEELGIKIEQDENTEVRWGGVRVSKIEAYYPKADNYSTILELEGSGNMYVIDMKAKDFEKLLKELD